jgi:FKBP-type peptidyl-prolyl cis-trans isomerase 2
MIEVLEMKKVFLLLVLWIILFGCTQNGVDEMTVEEGDKVNVEYIGRFPDTKEVFDKSEGRGPLEFTVGAGQMISGFDEAVIGMKLNEEKTVILQPEKAYGETNPEAIITVPIKQIQGGENIEVGSVLTMSNGRRGTVTEINNGNAVIDFNHELAGKTLEFWIKVVKIEKS